MYFTHGKLIYGPKAGDDRVFRLVLTNHPIMKENVIEYIIKLAKFGQEHGLWIFIHYSGHNHEGEANLFCQKPRNEDGYVDWDLRYTDYTVTL